MIVLLRQVILSVTAASLFGAVALALVPDGALKEAIRLGVGIVLILSLVIPLRGALPSGLSDLLPKAAEVQQDEAGDVYRAAIPDRVEAQTAEYVVQQAAEDGISCTAQATATVAEDGTVSITAVSIQPEDSVSESRLDALRNRLSTELGVPKDAILAE